jgi:chaperone required for assembly of F1-ATPase
LRLVSLGRRVAWDRMKRFYAEVGLESEAAGYTIRLDARPVSTPARRVLSIPSQPLASAIAAEWRAQGETIDTDAMRLTRLATTVVDLMPARRTDAIGETAGFAGTDLLCYRAARPASLAARQAAAWQPWLDWAERRYDARLAVAEGVMPVAQPAAALRALRAPVDRLDDWRLVALHGATTSLGSLVLGLAMEQGALDAAGAFAAALLDELFEIEQWGEDAEQTRRHARLRADLVAIERFLSLLTA